MPALAAKGAEMPKLQVVLVVACVLIASSPCIRHSQARPSPAAVRVFETTAAADFAGFGSSDVSARQFELQGDEGGIEVVCLSEMETCDDRKRVLTATIDYKNDGPNDPITEPPH